MRIIFFGTGKFGIPTLERIIESRHEVAAVVTQPDRKKDRGMKMQPTPIKEFVWTSRPEIEVIQPEKASEKGFIEHIKTLKADVFVVIDYGQILKKELLDAPSKYCINLHPSLLPKYRGPSPVAWAILNGDKETGNTVVKMNEKMDAGDVVLQKKTPVKNDDTAGELLKRLSYEGAELVMKAIELIDSKTENIVQQNEQTATYAPKLTRDTGRIDWRDEAESIERKVRAMQPWPGAFTYLDGKVLKIIRAEVCDPQSAGRDAGKVSMDQKFIVNTCKGKICVNMLQLEGKKAMTQEEFLRGYPIKKDTVLG
ncbi:MAG: methionyl-tRNA formyltransferase [Candidatus Omnitrophota bacterium]